MKRGTGSTKQTPLLPLLKLAKVETDSAFQAFLREAEHEPSFRAPPAFRKLLLDLQPFRYGLTCGFTFKDSKYSLFWFLSEFGAKGTKEEIGKKITESLEKDEFVLKPQASNDSIGVDFSKQAGNLHQHCVIQRIVKFTGTRDNRAGGNILFEVELQEPCVPLTVQQVLDTCPELRCSEVPEVFKQPIFPCVTSGVEYGGTRLHYYDFSVILPLGNAKDAAQKMQTLKNLLIKNNFTLSREDNDIFTYMKQGDQPPVIYLSLQGKNSVEFRIQPKT